MNIDHKAVFVLALAFACPFFFCGCSSDGHGKHEFVVETRIPTPPDFITGPASALFTNSDGFSALVTVDSLATASGKKTPAGRLVGRGGQLLYTAKDSDYTFLWDVAQHSGYVLSGSLQGYAPFSIQTQVTSFTTTSEAAGPASDKVDGHHGHEAQVSVGMSDGTMAKFTSWRASDLAGLPVHILAVTPAPPLEIHLTQARKENINPEIFQPPDGFTRFSSVEAMMLEKGSRSASIRNGGIYSRGNISLPPPEKARSDKSRYE